MNTDSRQTRGTRGENRDCPVKPGTVPSQGPVRLRGTVPGFAPRDCPWLSPKPDRNGKPQIPPIRPTLDPLISRSLDPSPDQPPRTPRAPSPMSFRRVRRGGIPSPALRHLSTCALGHYPLAWSLTANCQLQTGHSRAPPAPDFCLRPSSHSIPLSLDPSIPSPDQPPRTPRAPRSEQHHPQITQIPQIPFGLDH